MSKNTITNGLGNDNNMMHNNLYGYGSDNNDINYSDVVMMSLQNSVAEDAGFTRTNSDFTTKNNSFYLLGMHSPNHLNAYKTDEDPIYRAYKDWRLANPNASIETLKILYTTNTGSHWVEDLISFHGEEMKLTRFDSIGASVIESATHTRISNILSEIKKDEKSLKKSNVSVAKTQKVQIDDDGEAINQRCGSYALRIKEQLIKNDGNVKDLESKKDPYGVKDKSYQDLMREDLTKLARHNTKHFQNLLQENPTLAEILFPTLISQEKARFLTGGEPSKNLQDLLGLDEEYAQTIQKELDLATSMVSDDLVDEQFKKNNQPYFFTRPLTALFGPKVIDSADEKKQKESIRDKLAKTFIKNVYQKIQSIKEREKESIQPKTVVLGQGEIQKSPFALAMHLAAAGLLGGTRTFKQQSEQINGDGKNSSALTTTTNTPNHLTNIGLTAINTNSLKPIYKLQRTIQNNAQSSDATKELQQGSASSQTTEQHQAIDGNRRAGSQDNQLQLTVNGTTYEPISEGSGSNARDLKFNITTNGVSTISNVPGNAIRVYDQYPLSMRKINITNATQETTTVAFVFGSVNTPIEVEGRFVMFLDFFNGKVTPREIFSNGKNVTELALGNIFGMPAINGADVVVDTSENNKVTLTVKGQSVTFDLGGSALVTVGQVTNATTAAPTLVPTTAAPTQSPTTKFPTPAPTPAPTVDPTQSPTTQSPTEFPTTAPTGTPTTVNPTGTPTVNPTGTPTVNPTGTPTPPPSLAPSPAPTTVAPTSSSPSQQPSAAPSQQPSAAPSQQPSAAPNTLAPSQQPSAAPSQQPSAAPTEFPTQSPTTKFPTPAPTPAPTVDPTQSPTTQSPTEFPTPAPTLVPTTAAPTTPAPTSSSPTTAGPTTAGPTTVSPTQSSNTVAPTTAGPTTAAPTTESPTTAGPTTAAPTTAGPTTVSPTTPDPTQSPTEFPTSSSPTTESPTTVDPTTAAPTTVSPTGNPTTAVPTAAAPTEFPTQSPNTVAPTTAGPTTESPTTVDPTQSPTTTVSPTTESPTQSSNTVAPTTAGPTTVSPTMLVNGTECVVDEVMDSNGNLTALNITHSGVTQFVSIDTINEILNTPEMNNQTVIECLSQPDINSIECRDLNDVVEVGVHCNNSGSTFNISKDLLKNYTESPTPAPTTDGETQGAKSSSPTLGNGGIAGIAVGALAICCVAICFVACCRNKKNKPKKQASVREVKRDSVSEKYVEAVAAAAEDKVEPGSANAAQRGDVGILTSQTDTKPKTKEVSVLSVSVRGGVDVSYVGFDEETIIQYDNKTIRAIGDRFKNSLLIKCGEYVIVYHKAATIEGNKVSVQDLLNLIVEKENDLVKKLHDVMNGTKQVVTHQGFQFTKDNIEVAVANSAATEAEIAAGAAERALIAAGAAERAAEIKEERVAAATRPETTEQNLYCTAGRVRQGIREASNRRTGGVKPTRKPISKEEVLFEAFVRDYHPRGLASGPIKTKEVSPSPPPSSGAERTPPTSVASPYGSSLGHHDNSNAHG